MPRLEVLELAPFGVRKKASFRKPDFAGTWVSTETFAWIGKRKRSPLLTARQLSGSTVDNNFQIAFDPGSSQEFGYFSVRLAVLLGDLASMAFIFWFRLLRSEERLEL
jgi:hypothetical protein